MAAEAAAEEFAPAKVNLSLHVTGRCADGYHLLDSLVVFADVGDTVRAEPADRLSLSVEGPMAGGLAAGEDNLVLRAARLLGGGRGARLTLVKRLPVAAGIGGGSADAAAAIRALARLWGVAVPGAGALAALGADVPVCMGARAQRMRGIGEVLALVPGLPPLEAVLVNPGVAVPTAAVFRGLAAPGNPPMPGALPGFPDPASLIAFLAGCRNDLESPALAPAIGAALGRLRLSPGCALARMSGSGATCFGLFAGREAAAAAARAIAAERPGWWVTPARLG
ncbi:MAG: 4-(cytidine 5'-diphospho)-2-C-methyl-D-erythritol kinase [Paracoccaceae bacterium]